MEKVLEKKLANGVVFTCYDASRRMAGDRWLVRLRCTASLPFDDGMRRLCAGDDEESVYVREQLSGGLEFEMDMEKVFVDQQERDGVFAGLLERAEENLLDYMAKESFIHGLLAKKQAEYRERYRLRRQDASYDYLDDDDGPADFSDCFK